MIECPVGITHGTWSMNDAPVFFAAVIAAHFIAVTNQNQFLLVTAPDVERDEITEECFKYCTRGGRLMIDSGIFGIALAAAKRRGVDHNEGLRTPPEQIDGWSDFISSWKRCITVLGDACWGYVEIDLGGTEQKRKTRAALEAEGYRPIPVVHPITDGWDYFDELADTYDRLCIGNLVTSNEATRIDILRTVAERRRGRRVKWIHALGVTAGPPWLTAPTESCDSSSHATPLKHGLPMIETSAFRVGDVAEMPYRHAEKTAYVAMRKLLYHDADNLRRAVNVHLR